MISIITINYHVKEDLLSCLQSIYDAQPLSKFEIIVVDNDEEKTLGKDLKKKFPKVIYIPNENKGFGQGNNTGVKKAKGDFIFFLNPDTKIFPKTIDLLVDYLNRHKEVGIVAPILIDQNKNLYEQGANELTPVSALFTFSFIHTLFPKNPIAKRYWTNGWDKKEIKEVASVPGAAFVIRKEIFKKIQGFDENFFMYFEEQDLCKRVREFGWKIVMIPKSKVFHALGKSSIQVRHINRIFQQSRFYFFRKHYGLLTALLTESIMRTGKYTVLLLGILLLETGILFYKLPELMFFIGDQGWFYLSARDIVLTGNIPLVGIASSHPWLHQGALWTYMLAPVLALSHFHPLGGAYIAVFFGILSTILIYKTGSLLFSSRIGFIAALLYATSPLVLYHARTPYHTAPIPFLTLLYIVALYKWLQGREIFVPVIIFLLAVLYNFEIATFLFTIVFLVLFIIGILNKKQWALRVFRPKIIILSIISFIIPMLPMLIYDLGHGFPQTLKVVVWILYKIATTLGYPELNPEVQSTSFSSVLMFMGEYYKRLIYLPAAFVAFTIALFSFGFFYKEILDRLVLHRHTIAIYLLGLVTTISIIGLIVTKTISDAYLPILYPLIIFITALFFDKLITLRPRLKFIVWLILGGIAFMNVFAFIENHTLVGNGRGLAFRIAGAKQIVTQSKGRSYNLLGEGVGSNFESYTMNYEYLTWWLGNGPSNAPQRLKFYISENDKGVAIRRVE